MGLGHSPSIVRDGLVFYYDMGNTQKSWKGKPTTNLVPNGNFANGKTSWSFGGAANNYTSVTTFKNKTCIYAGGLQWYNEAPGLFYQPGISVASGTQYTVSFKYFLISGNIKFDPDGAYNGDISFTTPSTDWVTYSATFTASSTSLNLNFYGQQSVPSYYYLTDVQLEANSFATPFVIGTRSTTQALLDLTNNSTITASSLTYNSDNTFSFNGSSDYITIPNTLLGNGNIPWTVTAWIKTTTTATGLGGGSVLSNSSGGSVYSALGVNSGKIVYWTYQNSAWAQKLGVGKTVNDNAWHMLAWVNYSDYTMSMYVDGVLDSNVPNSTSGNNNPVDRIGGSWARYFPGSINILQRYTRALSATEIQQNFNALRGRFGV